MMQIQQFQNRFKKIPRILELDHLTVTGDVYFGRNVTLRGTVIGASLHADLTAHANYVAQSSLTRGRELTSQTDVSWRTVRLHPYVVVDFFF
jgi:UDP-N-acetylglucosamine pyrophosphorylase